MTERLHEADFGGVIGQTVGESTPSWPAARRPSAGAPNIVVIVLDDVGYAQLGCFGSSMRTPALDRLAAEGTRYANFHVTPLCSPTRACLLSGRNHHSVGMGMLAGFPSGFPNGRESVTHHAAMLPAVLRGAGYGTYAVGKWHLAPMGSVQPAGPFEHWPLAHGFDRFYGFLGGESDQYRPNLVADQHFIRPPDDDGYHLSEDLVDQALTMARGHCSASDERPFMLYVAFGACHGPHQAPASYRQGYRGAFDDGWDAARQQWFEQQLRFGVVPDGTRLPPPNPDVPRWAELTSEQRRLMARFQEAFAGFLEHTDSQIQRLLAGLDALGVLDDTVVVALSDNGASGEAGVFGTWNELIALNDFPAVSDRSLEMLDDLGAANTYPLYPAGWAQAGNTPGKWYKHHTFAGGVRAPLIVRWPGRTGDPGRIDRGFCHAIDLAPTLLSAAGVEVPTEHRGLAQMPMHGTAIELGRPTTGTAARTQYFEMGGHRGIYRDGWKAVTLHREGDDYAEDQWELYRLDDDFSEARDLAGEFPDVLADLVAAWWVEADRFDVLPLDDRFVERAATAPPRSPLTIHRGAPRIAEAALPALMRRRWTMACDIAELTPEASGVVMSYGGRFGGIVLYVDDATLRLDVNYFGEIDDQVRLGPLPSGPAAVCLTFAPTTTGAEITLQAGELPTVRCTVTHVVPYYSGGNGLEVGAAPLSPVSPHPAAACSFTGTFPSVVFTFDDCAVRAEPDANRQLAAWVAAD